MSEKEAIEKWLKKAKKKAPYYLFGTKNRTYYDEECNTKKGHVRVVIWKDGDKTKIGEIADGLLIRSGIFTYGYIKGKDISGLWQYKNGILTMAEINAILSVISEKHEFEEFNLDELKSLRW